MRRLVLLFCVLMICSYPMTTLAAEKKDITPSGIPYSELQQRIDDYVDDYIGKTTVGAAVAIVKDGELIINSSYGFADLEKQQKVEEDTVFEWGSATKLLVWTSVMQLVEQGKLDLKEDIRAYLPEETLTKTQFDIPITMLNLMHHDAGWEDKYTDLFYLSADDLKPLEEMLSIFEPYQVNKPGEIVAYSNYGVALAGYIVEQVSGQPFYEYVNEHIFTVLDMKDTTIHPSQEDNKNVALKREKIHGYVGNENTKFSRSKNNRIHIGVYPAGSAIGTAEDAAKFIVALMPTNGDNSPLFQHNNTLNEMLTTSDFYDDGLPRNAHGFWQGMYKVDVLEHAGNTDSFSSNFTFSKEENLGVIVLTNQIAESGLCYGLPVLVYGDYPQATNGTTLSSAYELEGSYMQARQVYKGFSKLYGVLMTSQLKAVDENTFTLLGMTFKQIAPYVYQSIDEYSLVLHFTMNDGKVQKVSMMVTDMLPVSTSMKVFVIISSIAVVLSILYLVVSLVEIIIGSIKNRQRSIPARPIRKWRMLINLAGLAALINIVILAYRTLNYAAYASLKFHFWISYAYVGIVIVSIVMIIIHGKKTSLGRLQRANYILSCIVGFLLGALIIVWELYK